MVKLPSINIKDILGYFIFLFILGLIGVIASAISLYTSVSTSCQTAKTTLGKDCVESLLLVVNDENYSFSDRNKAIWTLGQLADNRALPSLKALYTGNVPNNESLDTQLSQRELQKAIKWCEQGNITHYMYTSVK